MKIKQSYSLVFLLLMFLSGIAAKVFADYALVFYLAAYICFAFACSIYAICGDGTPKKDYTHIKDK